MSPSLGRCWFVLLVFVCHPPSSFLLFLLFFSIVLTGLTRAANNTCGQQNQVQMNYANPQSIHWATLSFFIHLGKLTQGSFLVVVGFYSVYFICWFSIGRARWAIHQQLHGSCIFGCHAKTGQANRQNLIVHVWRGIFQTIARYFEISIFLHLHTHKMSSGG